MDKNAEIPPLEIVLKIMDAEIAYEDSDVAKEVDKEVERIKALPRDAKST